MHNIRELKSDVIACSRRNKRLEKLLNMQRLHILLTPLCAVCACAAAVRILSSFFAYQDAGISALKINFNQLIHQNRSRRGKKRSVAPSFNSFRGLWLLRKARNAVESGPSVAAIFESLRFLSYLEGTRSEHGSCLSKLAHCSNPLRLSEDPTRADRGLIQASLPTMAGKFRW
jgi:hypothetical protein